MEPYLYTVIELRYLNSNKNSDKFYRGYLDQQTNEIFFQYGKYTTSALYWGSWTEGKQFDSLSDAHTALMKQVKAKLAKGYMTTRTVTLTCAKRATPSDLAMAVTNVPPDRSNAVIANV